MKRIIALALTLIMVLPLAACANEPNAETDRPAGEPHAADAETELMNTVNYPEAVGFEDYDARRELREQNELDESFIKSMDAFAFNTAVPVLGLSDGNANYSPLSLYFALAIGAAGAAGETQAEMLSLLGARDIAVIKEQCARLYRLLYTDNEISKLRIANSLWLDSELQGMPVNFKQAFCDAAARNFYASIYSADFAGEETGRAMAQWVADNTNGTLSPAFPADPNKLMSILNTVYFYDEWTDAFQKKSTEPATFHTASGDVTADFMNRETFGSFFAGEGFTRSALGLKNAGSMIFILPDEGVDVYSLLNNGASVETLFRGGSEGFGEIVWSIPKFTYGCKYDLADTLKTLGVQTAFSPEDADFSGVTDSRVWLSAVTQQTHIAIDENGVEASAYTELGYAGAGMPQGHADMILDRPFIYGITAANGALLFMGVVADPTA